MNMEVGHRIKQGPLTPACDAVHAEKYRSKGESFREAMNRVASALNDDDRHFRAFREIMLDMRFMPGGRIQSAMGSTRTVTPYNCFVSGTVEDSFLSGHGCIMDRAGEAVATMRMGGGIGYDFSTLRPRGSYIRKLQSSSAGPIPLMDIFDACGRAISSSGHRRGAQMGLLRCDHPDIEEFVHAKQNTHRLTGFNISIAVTDAFMQAVKDDKPFDLTFKGDVARTVDAAALWEMIMRSTWDWGEPGVIFIDRINALNNLAYCETIAATNPCSEQPLPPYGACLLGSFNLVKYLIGPEQAGGRFSFDHDQLALDIPHIVRAMDNVVDRAVYPLHEQENEARSKRRMGIGVTGLANALEATGKAYGSPEFLAASAKVLETLAVGCYEASIKLGREKGSFPLLDNRRYCESRFLNSDWFPAELRNEIEREGIRNSHLLSIAPTGTISLAAGNVSSGIEPVFEYATDRIVNFADGARVVKFEDYGLAALGVHGKRCEDVTIDEHIAVLSTAQRYVDSAVSKTCNLAGDVPWDKFKGLYFTAYENGCKGCTTYNRDGKRSGILKKSEDDEKAPPAGEPLSCEVDPVTGQRSCE